MDIDFVKDWEYIKQKYNEEYIGNDIVFSTFIKPLELIEFSEENKTLYIEVNDPVVYDIVHKKYEFTLRTFIQQLKESSDYDIKIFKYGEYDHNKENPTPAFKESKSVNNVTDKYTFETFVKGDNNSFAFNASLAVAENPGSSYNPLFLYGNSGLGKTHLMYSIKHFINENNPSLKVLYVTSEEFTTDFIESIRLSKDTNKGFREKYRNVDVLLIDDIQFIINKETTQEEFFHTFNALYSLGHQIVISSDKPPKDLTILDDRMISRFEQGLTVDIQPPTYETRMAILKNKANMDGYQNSFYHISDEVFDYIATHIKSNIRELEGALTKIVAFSKLSKNTHIDIDFAKNVLQEYISSTSKRTITPDLIISTVASHFNITIEDLVSSDRRKTLTRPRFIVMYLCKTMTDMSYISIANALCKKDHTTIMNGVKQITSEINSNPELAHTIDILKKKISPD